MKNRKKDYRQEVTDNIVKMMEQGTAPWQIPWNKEVGMKALIPQNGITGRKYNGGNLLYLMAVSLSKGYEDPRWFTFKQASDNEWQVKKGEKGTFVEYWQFYKEIEMNNDETGQTEKIQVKLKHPIVKYFCVFNGTQIDGITPFENKKVSWNPEESAETILKDSKALIYHDQVNQAFYRPFDDTIHLPLKEAFDNSKDYYSTALHELGHWTGHGSRLSRDGITGIHLKGSPEYAKEELRAELASLFVSIETGIPNDPQKNASYLKFWIKNLKEDKNEIFKASRDACWITEYIMDFGMNKEKEKGNEIQKYPEVIHNNKICFEIGF